MLIVIIFIIKISSFKLCFISAQTSSATSVILSAAIGVCGFLLVISVIVYFLLRKRYGKRRPSDEMVLRVHGSDGVCSVCVFLQYLKIVRFHFSLTVLRI